MDHVALRQTGYFKDANSLRLQGLTNDPEFFLVGYFNGHGASKSIVDWREALRQKSLLGLVGDKASHSR